MLNYQMHHWKNWKTAVKEKTGTTLRTSLKMLDGNDLSHELLLTIRQKKTKKSIQQQYINWFNTF